MPVIVGINARESGQPVALTSGTLVTAQSGLNIINDSGVRVVLNSGISIAQSGWYGVGLVIMGQYRAEMSGVATVLASGQLAVPGLSIDGDVRVDLDVADASGLRVIIQSGASVYLQSGSPVTVGLVSLSGINIASDGHIGVNIDTVDSSGLRVVIQSGAPVSIQSGTYVNIGSGVGVLLQSGINVNIGSGIGVITASGVFVVTDSGQRVVIQSGASVSLQSGLPVNIGSGVGVLIQSGINVNIGSGIGIIQASGAYIINDSGVRVVVQSGAPISVQSGTYVNIGSGTGVLVNNQSGIGALISGQGVAIASGISYQMSGAFIRLESGENVNIGLVSGVILGSGISYQMSGANVIATVSVGSGLYTVAGGINRAINSGGQTVLASGVIAIPSLDVNGNLVVMTSGQTANMISGQALFVQMSGVNAWMSGLYVNTGVASASVSGNVVQISGQCVDSATPSSLNANYVMIGSQSGGVVLSSGNIISVRVRNIPGNNNMFIGPPGVNSGTGYLVLGGESTDIDIGNLGAVYMVAVTSGQLVSYLGCVE